MISKSVLQTQYNRAKKLGWIDDAHAVEQATGVGADLLLAIGSRETNLDPKYLQIAGDGGHGYGLTQGDIGSYPEWIKSGKWKVAKECFALTADILEKSQERFARLGQVENVQRTIRTRQGKTIPYLTKKIRQSDTVLRIAIAAYNCGEWAFYHYCVGNDIDRGTTPGPSGKPDYSADVLYRRSVFAHFLAADFAEEDVVLDIEAGTITKLPPTPQTDYAADASVAIPPVPSSPPATTEKAQEAVSSEVLGQVVEFARRPGSIKSLRTFLGMLGLGSLSGVFGWFEHNQAFIFIALGIVTLFCLLYFLRQWHLDAIHEKKQ